MSNLGTFNFTFDSPVTLTTIVIDSDIVSQNVTFYTDTFYKDFNNTEVNIYQLTCSIPISIRCLIFHEFSLSGCLYCTSKGH